MKKILKFNFLLLVLGMVLVGIVPVKASNRTGHKEFTRIDFAYNKDAKLLVFYTKDELDEMMNGVKRRAFGWSVNTEVKNNEVVYEAGSVFSRSNNTSQAINFTYNTTSTTKNQLTYEGSGSIAMKLSGKIESVSTTLDNSIRLEIGVKKEMNFVEEMDFTIKILPKKKVSLIVKGNALLSNGASKYYFLGLCTKKNYWEYIDIYTEYYELYEENLNY